MESDTAVLLHQDRPFACETCPKKYLRKNNLEDHVLMEHPDTDQMNGALNGFGSFRGKIGRRPRGRPRGSKNGYRNGIPYFGGAKLSSAKGIVEQKARTGRSKGSLIIRCDICSKRFRYNSDLRNHYETHFRKRGKNGGPMEPRDLASRPCLYCGKTFPLPNQLAEHERMEAREFEREALKFEDEDGHVVTSDFDEPPHDSYQQVIDRTDEEFGDDDESQDRGWATWARNRDRNWRHEGYGDRGWTNGDRSWGNGDSTEDKAWGHEGFDRTWGQENGDRSWRPENGDTSWERPDSPTANGHLTNGQHGHSENSMTSPGYSQPLYPKPMYPPHVPYPDHTSQYTNYDYPGHHYQPYGFRPVPPPAHEDPTTQYGFYPPPPPLQAPHCTTQVHTRNLSEFPDPNEEKTYITLKTKEESHTTRLIESSPNMSPTGHVLDLSVPKAISSIKDEDIDETTSDIEEIAKEIIQDRKIVEAPDAQVKYEETPLQEDRYVPYSVPQNDSWHSEQNNSKYLPQNEGLSEIVWNSLQIGEGGYSEMLKREVEEEEYSYGSRSPVQFDDPNRMDCKHCGMLFEDSHVRKFHETSHDELADDPSRLTCTYCGKTFKKAKYRMVHEKGHTGELPVICQFCGRKFRWLSELKNHNANFCTAEKPCRGPLYRKALLAKQDGKERRERLLDKEDWIDDHPSLPTGWKYRTRPRPAQEGQLYFFFCSPAGEIFHSRKAVLQYMEKEGGYNKEDFMRVKSLAKPGPRGRRGKRGGQSQTGSPRKPEQNGHATPPESPEPEEVPESPAKARKRKEIEGIYVTRTRCS